MIPAATKNQVRYYDRFEKSELADRILRVLDDLRSFETHFSRSFKLPSPCWEKKRLRTLDHLQAQYQARSDRTYRLTFCAIQQCKRVGDRITLRRLQAVSKSVDPEKRGVGRRAILRNPRAHRLYLRATKRKETSLDTLRGKLEKVTKAELINQLASLLAARDAAKSQVALEAMVTWHQWLRTNNLERLMGTHK